jgi:crossover junction endodeoxyribonuclease RuvC
MRVLGIDPGTRIVGYGLVDHQDETIQTITFGCLNYSSGLPLPDRLKDIYLQLVRLIEKYQPDTVAIEQPFVAKNARSALLIGKAQSVAILAGANCDLPTFEYTPTQVKMAITGYGSSSKEQIQEMVRLQLNLPDIPHPADSADALAVALCHIQMSNASKILYKNE